LFQAKDPEGLAAWYETGLGVSRVPTSYNEAPWRQEAGPTVNFRVRDLDAMAARLRASGIVVDIDANAYPNGRFAHLQDPEGNRIEPWEPAG